MIKVIDLVGEFIDKAMSFEVQRNSKAVFIFEKHEQGEEFLKMLIGMKKPKIGEVFLMGQNLKKLTREQIFELRKRIAIVFKTGGLISNLKTWENLLFPALYHKVSDKEVIEKKGIELLKEFEFKKEPMCSVAQLTNLEKRIIAIARGFLINPEIMFFEYPFDGLSQGEKEWLAEKIEKFGKNLTLLYVLSSETESYLVRQAM